MPPNIKIGGKNMHINDEDYFLHNSRLMANCHDFYAHSVDKYISDLDNLIKSNPQYSKYYKGRLKFVRHLCDTVELKVENGYIKVISASKGIIKSLELDKVSYRDFMKVLNKIMKMLDGYDLDYGK